RRRHTRFSRDWSSDVCSSDLRREPVQDAQQLMDALLIRDRVRQGGVPEGTGAVVGDALAAVVPERDEVLHPGVRLVLAQSGEHAILSVNRAAVVVQAGTPGAEEILRLLEAHRGGIGMVGAFGVEVPHELDGLPVLLEAVLDLELPVVRHAPQRRNVEDLVEQANVPTGAVLADAPGVVTAVAVRVVLRHGDEDLERLVGVLRTLADELLRPVDTETWNAA